MPGLGQFGAMGEKPIEPVKCQLRATPRRSLRADKKADTDEARPEYEVSPAEVNTARSMCSPARIGRARRRFSWRNERARSSIHCLEHVSHSGDELFIAAIAEVDAIAAAGTSELGASRDRPQGEEIVPPAMPAPHRALEHLASVQKHDTPHATLNRFMI
jgi:hypothetical protein